MEANNVQNMLTSIQNGGPATYMDLPVHRINTERTMSTSNKDAKTLLENCINDKDPRVQLVSTLNNRSAAWTQYKKIYWRKQYTEFACCSGCGKVIKQKGNTTGLHRHQKACKKHKFQRKNTQQQYVKMQRRKHVLGTRKIIGKKSRNYNRQLIVDIINDYEAKRLLQIGETILVTDNGSCIYVSKGSVVII
ncbi:hypothetical protein B4U80_14509, partial [Leptotrombidium deliense]